MHNDATFVASVLGSSVELMITGQCGTRSPLAPSTCHDLSIFVLIVISYTMHPLVIYSTSPGCNYVQKTNARKLAKSVYNSGPTQRPCLIKTFVPKTPIVNANKTLCATPYHAMTYRYIIAPRCSPSSCSPIVCSGNDRIFSLPHLIDLPIV